MPKVSIVVPCYNHGKYIDEAIRSVESIKDKSLYELIIVNDGSKDEFTNSRLKELAAQGYNVIFQHNQGLAASRNNAISASSGEYILPLDADNKIRPEYVYRGIEILENNKDISVVYGNAQLFGDSTGIMRPGPYNLQKLMLGNYIDACAFYRREVWEKTGGYDKNMPFTGIEDWDMWLGASFIGYRFCYVDEVLFDYRVLGDSMIRNLKASKRKGDANLAYLMKKHKQFFGPQYVDEYFMSKFSGSAVGFMSKLFLKRYFPGKFRSMVEKGDLREYL